VGCGYNLRGVSGGQSGCPECGEEVSRALARYPTFWFDEGWLRGVLKGRVCILGSIMAMPSLIVLLLISEVTAWRLSLMHGVQVALWGVIFVVLGVGVWWMSRPVRWGKERWPGDVWHASAFGIGWVMVMLTTVWFGVAMARRDSKDANLIWEIAGLGLFFMVGAGLAQLAVIRGMVMQCRDLGGAKLKWWANAAYVPLSLWKAGLFGLAVWGIFHWELRDKGGVMLAVLCCAAVVGMIPALAAAFVMNKAARLVDEAIHMRMGARVDASAPEGVELEAAFWPWMQKRMAQMHERRRMKMFTRSKRV
jgi:hypothetical protein